MKEQLIAYETAVLAKEKGFDYWTEDFFFNGKEEGHWDEGCPVSFDGEDYYIIPHDKSKDIVNRPRQALLQKWLREEKEIYVFVEPITVGIKYGWKVFLNKGDWTNVHETYLEKTYEKALEEGLKQALELI